MNIGIIGVNHRCCALQDRERLSRVFGRVFGGKGKHVLLSTCNRTELYFSSEDLPLAHGEILQMLRDAGEESFEHYLYSFFGLDCFYHLGRVISGIDSAIFGESDIQRQVKIAYETKRKKVSLDSTLHYLFQKGLKVGKEMRSNYLKGKRGGELAATLYSVLEWLHEDPRKLKILFIGNSAINRKILTYFDQKQAQHITLATRYGAEDSRACGWEVIRKWDTFDVVISAAHHNGYILNESASASKTVIFDLSIPRNVDPHLGKHPLIHLYNIDQIGSIAQRAGKRVEKEILFCENVVDNIVERQFTLYHKNRVRRCSVPKVVSF